jgi:hypothetical protein
MISSRKLGSYKLNVGETIFDSVGYQPVHTRIGLAMKAMSLQANQERKQEQERTISNGR